MAVLVAPALFVTLTLALFLFADSSLLYSKTPIIWPLRELAAVVRDSTMQWMLAVFLVVYATAFVIVQLRRNPKASRKTLGIRLCWLAGLLFLTIPPYARSYPSASQSTEALTLLTGIVLGQGAAAWLVLTRSRARTGVLLLAIILGLLLIGSLLDVISVRSFQYFGRDRESGIWENPNLFGALMGTGAVLMVGAGLSLNARQRNEWMTVVLAIVIIVALIVFASALLKSYSRGAWLSTVIGLSYLAPS